MKTALPTVNIQVSHRLKIHALPIPWFDGGFIAPHVYMLMLVGKLRKTITLRYDFL